MLIKVFAVVRTNMLILYIDMESDKLENLTGC